MKTYCIIHNGSRKLAKQISLITLSSFIFAFGVMSQDGDGVGDGEGGDGGSGNASSGGVEAGEIRSTADFEIRGANAGPIDLPGPSEPPAEKPENKTESIDRHSDGEDNHPDISPSIPATPSPQGQQPAPGQALQSNPETKITANALRTVQNIADSFSKLHPGVRLRITRGNSTPQEQAKEMYKMLRADASKSRATKGIEKYSDHKQAHAIEWAFEVNRENEPAALEAMAKIISENQASGHPISNHLTENGAVDLGTKEFYDDFKRDLFRICKQNKVHCIYEVPDEQMSHAKSLAKEFGVSVLKASVEHLHVDAKVDPNHLNSVQKDVATPDFWVNRYIREEDNLSSLSEKWFKADEDTWVEWSPPPSGFSFHFSFLHPGFLKSEAGVHIWKDRGGEMIEGVDYRRLETVVGERATQLKKVCWIPALGAGSLLTVWDGGDNAYMPTPRFVKHAMAYPSDDVWCSNSSSRNASVSVLQDYTLVKGDSAYTVSKNFQMSIAEFLAVNPKLDTIHLKIGQKVKVWSPSN